LVAERVPPSRNSMDVLNDYFLRFGPVTGMQINHNRHEAIVTFAKIQHAEEALQWPVLGDSSIGLRPWRCKGGSRGPQEEFFSMEEEAEPMEEGYGWGEDYWYEEWPPYEYPPKITNKTAEFGEALEKRKQKEEAEEKRKQELASLTAQIQHELAKVSDPAATAEEKQAIREKLKGLREQMEKLTPEHFKEQTWEEEQWQPPAWANWKKEDHEGQEGQQPGVVKVDEDGQPQQVKEGMAQPVEPLVQKEELVESADQATAVATLHPTPDRAETNPAAQAAQKPAAEGQVLKVENEEGGGTVPTDGAAVKVGEGNNGAEGTEQKEEAEEQRDPSPDVWTPTVACDSDIEDPDKLSEIEALEAAGWLKFERPHQERGAAYADYAAGTYDHDYMMDTKYEDEMEMEETPMNPFEMGTPPARQHEDDHGDDRTDEALRVARALAARQEDNTVETL